MGDTACASLVVASATRHWELPRRASWSMSLASAVVYSSDKKEPVSCEEAEASVDDVVGSGEEHPIPRGTMRPHVMVSGAKRRKEVNCVMSERAV